MSTSSLHPHGVFSAALTPLDAELAPDHARFVEHCRYLLDEGCNGIALLGTGVRVEAMPNPRPDTGGRRTSTGGAVGVAAGRLTAQKGFDRLIRAWGRLAAEHPDWELRIFGGTGPAQPRPARYPARRDR